MAGPRRDNFFGLLMGAGLAAGVFGLLVLGERRRPLRRPAQPKARRVARNLALAAATAAVVQVADRPLTRRLSARVERRRGGLVHAASLPRWARDALAFLLL